MQRLPGGPWVKKVADNLRNYSNTVMPPHTNGTPHATWKRKLYMYSGHDVSVATVLSALQIFNGVQPPHASMLVLIELHERRPKKLFVQVLHKNVSDDGEDPSPLTLPGCDTYCPLDSFFQLIRNVISDDLKLECKLTQPPPSYNPVLVIGMLSGLCVLLLLAFLAACAFWARREKNGHAYTAIQAE